MSPKVTYIPNPEVDGRPVYLGPSFEPASLAINITLAEPVKAFDVITIMGKRAHSDKLDSDQVAGLASIAGNAGETIKAIYHGLVVNDKWSWPPGSPIFLVNDGLSEARPTVGWLQQVGVAASKTGLMVKIEQPIQL